jgi:eukaryotic-like serine/threonine-protein kinase
MLEIESDESAADPLIGKVIQGRYRPTKLIGEGGMGRVYIAEQKMGAATRKVAIKTLHPELGQDPQLVARFNRECETVIELSHPNTIQFFDFGTLDDGTLFIVMEYIEGRSLAAEMEKGIVDPAKVDKILVQVCGSLHEAHGRGIVHRDLKPDNILLTDRGGQADFVKVLDFGIAKKGEAEDPQKAKLTKQGMVLGTPPYMSPEQFSGKTLDARSDIYSLGVMAFEMLTGSLPFDAKTPWEWATKHLTAQPAPFEAFPAGVNVAQNKKNAVMRALSKAPEQRHSTVLELLQEFTGHQDAQAAWTMATSAGGQIMPKGQPSQPFQTHTPAPHTGGPGYGTSPAFGSSPAYGTSPPFGSGPGSMGGMVSSPQMTAQQAGAMGIAGTAQMPQYGSAPGVVGAVPSYGGTSAGFAPNTLTPAPTGSGAGRWVLVGVLGLFMVLGASAGAIFFFMRDNGSDPVAGGTTVVTGGPGTTTIPSTPMVPMMPTTTGGPGTVGPGTVGPGTTGPGTTGPGTTGPGTVAATPDAGRPPVATADDDDDTPSRPRVSAADEARARSLNASGLAALGRRDYRNAVASLEEANRLVGRRSTLVAELRRELGARGGREIGSMIMSGNCPGAQALYRDLNRVGAASGARSQFTDWCAAPR